MTDRALVVLHVAEVIKGGTASYLEELCRPDPALSAGLAHQFLVPDDQHAFLPKQGVDVAHATTGSRRRWLNVWRLMLALPRAARGADLVHAHGTFGGLAARLLKACGLLKAPVVYCAHGWAFDRDTAAWKQSLFALAERVLAPWADRIVCISEHDFKRAQQAGLPASKLALIRNGIEDLVVPPPQAPRGAVHHTRPTVLFAGRFDRQKGVDVFFSALSGLEDAFNFVAIGDASAGDLAGLTVPANVSHLGWLPRQEVQQHLANAAVFVMPSRWEGFGLSALEAMRAGKVVVASAVGGLNELVDHGQTGLLCTPGDVESLRAALQQARALDLIAMGERARARFKMLFVASRMRSELLALYLALGNKTARSFGRDGARVGQ